jgi:phage terminase large subunit-like protein
VSAAEFDPEEWKRWSPEAQRKALEFLNMNKNRPWKEFYCPNRRCNGRPHVRTPDGLECEADSYGHWWYEHDGEWTCTSKIKDDDPEFGCGKPGRPLDPWLHAHARADQRPPPWYDHWRTWLIGSGRGGGKTETGSRLTHRVADLVPRMILIGATGPDLRETMVEGVSGILATSEPGKRPQWEPSKKKLTWPNGAIANGFSAEEPDRLRGPQSGFIWGDEWAHFEDPKAVWENALFGMRLGRPSHVLVTTTPKPVEWLKELVKDELTVFERVSTYANLYNLDPAYRRLVIDKYEGTRIGRQELHGELLEDVEGSLWTADMIQRGPEPPEYDQIVVSLDPAGSANARSDETGIIVVGYTGGIAYVLADRSGKYSPAGWGNLAWNLHEEFKADCIVAEKNYGNLMVKHVLEGATRENAKIHLVDSRRGKQLRAEPMVTHYEKKRVIHCGKKGELERLEDEMLTWVPGYGSSPNRVDALVHGLTYVFRHGRGGSLASPSDLLPDMPSPNFGYRPPMRGTL